jgi:hypothetical protein
VPLEAQYAVKNITKIKIKLHQDCDGTANNKTPLQDMAAPTFFAVSPRALF